MQNIHIGFLGAGGIARAHAYALQSLKFYYSKVPQIHFESVASARKESRENFAENYGFSVAQPAEEFFRNEKIDSVFILGPNHVHFKHLEQALGMPGVKRIYLEKPVCASLQEEEKMKDFTERTGEIKIQVGFSTCKPLRFAKLCSFGKAVNWGNLFILI